MTKFKQWLFDIGEKSNRTDVWVFLFVLITLASASCFFLCGLGILEHCNEDFVLYNTYILISSIGAMVADWGIKRWKESTFNVDEITDLIIKKLNKYE